MLFRQATADDVSAIVALLHDDILGMNREDPEGLDRYTAAFAEIDLDESELLVVAERDGVVVGTMQLSFLPGLSRGAARRLQIEAVRVSSAARGTGLGEQMMRWALAEGRSRGCELAQLTSDRRRDDAHRFYEGLGFIASHAGYKIEIPPL